jgi:hypothetical protein
VLIREKAFFPKFDTVIIQLNSNFDAEFESVEKSAKNHPKQVIGQRFLHTVIKLKNSFSVTVSLITFFA